jgi:uncharacterized protein (DUF342 family)
LITYGKSIVSKGRTVKDAVILALDLLSEEMDGVEIEVVETETKGILGIGAKPAIVRVTVKPKAAPMLEMDLENMVHTLQVPGRPESPEPNRTPSPNPLNSLDRAGKAWIQDGQITCQDAPGKYPMISPGRGIELYKNGELVEQTTIIIEEDKLQVDFQDAIQECAWEITLSQDKMAAYLKIVPGVRIHRRLKDKPPSPHLKLDVTEEKTVHVEVDSKAVMDKLKELGVVYGIDYTEISRVCGGQEAGQFLIAKGLSPSPGKNGCFVPELETEIQLKLKERKDGTVDYREIQDFPSVESGEVIGTVELPVPGMPGTNVMGDIVLPPEALPLLVQTGISVMVVENGSKVIATDSGHPVVKVKGRSALISVVPKLMIGKDVDLQVGNVHYTGDVEIVGSVQDGMLVEVQGNVLIHENVNSAKVVSGGSIIVKNNIISSEIVAGSGSILLTEIHEVLGRLIPQFKQMEAAILQLQTVSAFKSATMSRTGLGPLIKILCDGKFKSFASLISALVSKIEKGADLFDTEWKEFGERLHNGFTMAHASYLTMEDFVLASNATEIFHEKSRSDDEGLDSFVQSGYVHNSLLYSSGNIYISAPGIYQSKFHAGGHIEVNGSVRGGLLFAAKGVKLDEVGSRGGVGTKITVPFGETIRIRSVMEGTVIQIGDRIHRFDEPSAHVCARLNEERILILY